MSRFVVTLLVFLGGAGAASAQSGYDLMGSARAAALGHATTALPSAVGLHANPGAGAAQDHRAAAVYAREGFGLSALRYGTAFVTVPMDWGALSGGAGTFGFEDYREVHLDAGYARGFSFGTSRSVHVGVRLRYYHTRITNYGSAGALGLHLGLLVRLLPTLQFGAHATNINTPSLTDGEVLPRTMAVGLKYEALSSVQVLVDVFKDLAFSPSVRGGLEYHPVPALALRSGVTTAPTQFTVGAGVDLGPIEAGVAAEQHQELGWSPSASFLVAW